MMWEILVGFTESASAERIMAMNPRGIYLENILYLYKPLIASEGRTETAIANTR